MKNTLNHLAQTTLEHRVTSSMARKEIWDKNMLTKPWCYNSEKLKKDYTLQSQGWNWISLHTLFVQLQKLESKDCKKVGCIIGEVAAKNLETFTESLFFVKKISRKCYLYAMVIKCSNNPSKNLDTFDFALDI